MPGNDNVTGGAMVREPADRGDSGGGAISEMNALGQEIAYGGETQSVANSRLFGVHEQAQNLNQYRGLDASSQAGMIESIANQLKGRVGGALTARASKDILALWRNTSKEAKDLLAQQGFGELKSSNAAAKEIASDVAKRQTALEKQQEKASRAKRRKAQAPASQTRQNDDDLDFSVFF